MFIFNSHKSLLSLQFHNQYRSTVLMMIISESKFCILLLYCLVLNCFLINIVNQLQLVVDRTKLMCTYYIGLIRDR